MKSKVLLVAVGTGEGTENGIVASIKDSLPEYITFIMTEKSKVIYEKVIDKLSDEDFIDKNEIILSNGEEEDFQKVFIKVKDCINSYISKGIKKENIFIDITFGTKAITAGLITAGIYEKIKHIKYVSGGNRDKISGKVISGTEKIIIIQPTEIFNHYYYDEFKNFFNSYQFEASKISISNISDNFFYDYNRGNFKDAYDYIIFAYSQWDRFNYTKAYNELCKNKEKYKLIKDFNHEKYKKNFEFLEKLSEKENKEKYSEEIIVDIFSNAKRRAEEKKFDDALIRLYRVMELISQNSLYYKHGIDPSNIEESQFDKIPELIRKKIKENIKRENKKNTSGMSDNFEILKSLNDKIGIKFFDDKKIRDLLNIRNNSILIHGEKPISENNFNNLLEIVNQYLILFFNNEDIFNKKLELATMAKFRI